jgi:hypothetical protein
MMLCECIILFVPNIREAYISIPGRVMMTIIYYSAYIHIHFINIFPPSFSSPSSPSPLLALGFLQFFFSGIPCKSSSQPDWIKSWVSSCSLIRWGLQASAINEFENDTETFPYVTALKIDPYEEYLNTFGWGGCMSSDFYTF